MFDSDHISKFKFILVFFVLPLLLFQIPKNQSQNKKIYFRENNQKKRNKFGFIKY